MNKRIFSVFMCVLLVAAMALTSVAASAAQHETTILYVTTEKTEAVPGDVLDFTVVMGPVSELGTVQMTLTIPEGLTYVAGSGKVADGVREQMGFDDFDWTEETLMINGVASEANYESDVDTVLGSFQCTVNEGFEGQASVQLGNLEFADCQTWDMITDRFSVAASVVNVGGSDPDGTAATETDETTATESDETSATEIAETSATEAATQAASATATQAPTTGQKNASPKTGDSGMLFVGIALIALALLGAGATFYGKARKNG